MVHVKLKNVSVDIPVFNARSRSLKSQVINAAVNSRLSNQDSGCVLIKALKNVSVTIHSGEKVGLIGGNGAGKSTFLRVLSGVYKPTTGEINHSGKVGSLIDISLGIDPEATGRENVYIRGGLLGVSKKKLESHMEEIQLFSGLEGFFDMPVRTYSSGMQLRLAFSVSTILTPEILLMDEWLSVGDDAFRKRTEERLDNMVEATRILVIASHSMELLKRICNRIIWLDNGQVKLDGSPNNVISSYLNHCAVV